MEQDPFSPSSETFEKPLNIPLAIIGALGGAAIGIAIWAAVAAFTDSYYYVTPIFVGAFAGGGAAKLGGKGHITFAILGLIIGTIAIVLGDFAESAAWLQREFGEIPKDVSIYTDLMQFKIQDDMIRGLTYLGGIAVAFIAGIADPDGAKKKN